MIVNAKQQDELHWQVDFNKNIIPELLTELYTRKIQSIIIEGGEKTLQSFIAGNYFDEIQVEIGSYCCQQGTPAPIITQKGLRQEIRHIGDATFMHYYR